MVLSFSDVECGIAPVPPVDTTSTAEAVPHSWPYIVAITSQGKNTLKGDVQVLGGNCQDSDVNKSYLYY